jgi:hypothetical protein
MGDNKLQVGRRQSSSPRLSSQQSSPQPAMRSSNATTIRLLFDAALPVIYGFGKQQAPRRKLWEGTPRACGPIALAM